MLKSAIFFSLAAALWSIGAEEVPFRIKVNSVTMIVKLSDPDLIKHARTLLRGKSNENPHIQGNILKVADPMNSPWTFTLDPKSVSFFDGNNTANGNSSACDIGIRWAEYHLDYICDTMLPNCFWCPVNSTVIEEVKTKLTRPMPPRKKPKRLAGF